MSAYETLPLNRRPTRRVQRRPRATEGEGSAQGIGYVHSTESFGTLDGPGIRFVVFFQGCHLRCLFCQNRDSWEQGAGRSVTAEELINEALRYHSYMESSGGGITASGGDPILQPRFVSELFRAANEEGIHTALDTSGLTHITPAVEALLEATDLVLLDLKQIDSRRHRVLTGHGNERVLAFARHLAAIEKPVWIRHVVVPGHTDDEESAGKSAAFLSTLGNVERVDLLPYHAFGKHKWEALGEPYRLEQIEPPTAELMEKLTALFRDAGLPVGGA